ncbi:uncharacterized protein [Ptychodera flava]|uniref:uncharacterized protein isoform X2 n=1 Tax=Ptychodera flava TaxID=63121 RepID=UPI003969E01F
MNFRRNVFLFALYNISRVRGSNIRCNTNRFGGSHFSFDRMSWIKTNFLWMMYRCGWAEKRNQERVLAVWISRDGFNTILKNAYTPLTQKAAGLHGKDSIEVRLQWDPDHKPNGNPENRRAIQLGLKKEMLRKYATEWVVQIEDITPFVKSEKVKVDSDTLDDLMVAEERVYHVEDQATAKLIEVDHFER